MATAHPWADRLRHASPSVRRIAILDALCAQPPALAELLTHAEHEHDERAALLIVRGVIAAHERGAPLNLPHAQATLARLRDHPATPPALAHAALLAHDTLTTTP